jgi:hypothetical protein
MFLVVMLFVAAAVSLPFLLVDSDDVRKRIFMPLSAVPPLLTFLFYWLGYNAYSIAFLGFFWVLPVSWALFIIGLTLGVRAWSRDEDWEALAWGVLLACSPVILFIMLILVALLGS